METKRDYSIDIMRAIAIVMVVFGHSIIIYSSQWNIYQTTNRVFLFDKIKDLINVVQMPLFFSLSGALFSPNNVHLAEMLKKKTKRLLVPFVVFGLLWLLPIRLLIKYPGYNNLSLFYIVFNKIVLGKDNGHLWYLPTLFFCFFLSYIFSAISYKFIKNENIFCLINSALAGILFFLSVVLHFDSYFYPIGSYYIWFTLGRLLYVNIQNIRKRLTIRVISVVLCMATIVLILFYFNQRFRLIINTVCSFVWVITFYIFIPNKQFKITQYISKNSFGIYLFHSPLVYITYTYWPNYNPVFVLLINFIGFGSLSLILTELIRHSRFCWLIGDRSSTLK